MIIVLRKVTILDPGSPHHNLEKDILVEDGVIKQITDGIDPGPAQVVDCKGCFVTQGWVDVFANFCDPGFEFKETLETGAAAAAAGGYTNVFVVPDTQPAISNKSQVEYVVQRSKSLPVNIRPLGAISRQLEGKELAEMYDMYNSGAVAFSDGLRAVQSAGVLLKALQYVKVFDGVLVSVAMDNSIGKHGLMNEGIVSTRLGLPGAPAIAEELMIARDIELVKYTNGKLHFTGVSTEKGLQLIADAKQQGLAVTCSVTPYHISFCDEDLQGYDTNLKLNPPLRTRADMMALREAVASGKVDCIASHHMPQDWDNKVCEFEYAKPGMIGLQTSYAAVQTACGDLKPEAVASLFSQNARKIFGLPTTLIEEGAVADLTLFNPKMQSMLTKQTNKSKCNNSAFLDKPLTGAVVGIIHKGTLHLNN